MLSLHWRQHSREGQVARRVADVDGLGRTGDDPVLRDDVPLGQIATDQGRGPCGCLAWCDAQAVELAKLLDGFVAAEGDVLFIQRNELE